jgi:hypothetical protein
MGERRSFALLRPVVDTTAQNAVRDRILEAYAEYEEAAAATASRQLPRDGAASTLRLSARSRTRPPPG